MGIVFLAVDALNLIRRVYAAAPGADRQDAAKPARDALEATVQSLRRALKETSPTHAVSVFDGLEPTWRHELYPDYKAGRKPMPEALKSDLDRYREKFQKLGVHSVAKPHYEADDVIATLAMKVAASGSNVIILSTDKVYCQLVSNHVRVRDHFQKRGLDEAYVMNKLGVRLDQLVDLWALAGSATTHIPGVPKVGAKTAAKLLAEHDNLEQVLTASRLMTGKLGENLRHYADQARMSQKLARLRGDLELGWNLKSFRLLR